MDFYTITAILITFSIGVAYINLRFIGMPMTIGVMFAALLTSGLLIFADALGFHALEHKAIVLAGTIDFHDFLMNGILSFLLFAGGLSIHLEHLKRQKWEISILASLGTISSAMLVGTLVYYLLSLLGVHLQYIYCLLFGALISPTDPIAVLALFKSLKAPKESSILLEGESLFNDGVGIVIFLTIYQVAFHGVPPTFSSVSLLFLKQAIGGIAYGYILGWITVRLLKPIHDSHMPVLLTLALVTGGYAFAEFLDVSGPLAMVVAGIVIGHLGRSSFLSDNQNNYLEQFWSILDEVLNAILFLMIGFELLLVKISGIELIAGIAVIPLVLLVRFITVAIPMGVMKQKKIAYWPMVSLLTWGGLRGGLAVALALSLPAGDYRSIILTMTYCIVVFAIIVQGMTVKPFIRKIV
ncbi:MAG: sodium:proton antiporter [Legionellales bacterium]|nr:sodium:proton antiporter [Legionellales bacterium]